MKTPEEIEDTKKWAAKKFDIKPEEVVSYNHGVCYDQIVVTTKEAADKVTEKVKHRSVNGGILDGMALGGQSANKPGLNIDVIC